MGLENIKILIVEDEVIIAESIKLFLLKMNYENIMMAHDISSAEALITSWKPSITLLDIHLENEDDGIRLGKMAHALQIPFMYITANTDNITTQKVLQTQPTGFISKPIRLNEFKINLHMLMKQLEGNGEKIITLSNGSEQIQFKESSLKYLMSAGNYVEIHLVDRRHIIRNTLENCLKEMNSKQVMRIHRSYVVVTDRIVRNKITTIELEGEELPVSRTYQPGIKQALIEREVN